MKKYLLSSFLVLFSFLLAVAAPVDEQQARKIASDFLRGKMPHVTRAASGELTRAVTGVADGDNAGIYVFNADNSFVIVSADDRTPAVLGYSDNGAFDKNNVPDGLKSMLMNFQQALSSNRIVTRGAVPTHNAIKALLKTKWNQFGPYNLSCPVDKETGETSVAGCVATAMAQVMYYHKWPATYEWDKMKTEYATTDSTEAAYAVAKLMADVGAAVKMDYSSKGSSASAVYAVEALRNTFGYALSTDYSLRTNYTVVEWDALIYNNLAESKPVMYSGQAIDIDENGVGVQAGHSFVVDGYDGEGLYHVNWGWGGLSDGYFLLSLMNPDNQGAGGTSGSEGYGFGQDAIVGIAPAASTHDSVVRMWAELFTVNDKAQLTLNRSNTSADFPKFKTQYVSYNIWPDAQKCDVGLALYQGEKLVKLLETDALEFPAGKGYYVYYDCAFGKDLADGTYQLRPVCHNTGQSDFVVQLQGMDCYVNVVIDGLTMQLTVHGLSSSQAATKFTCNSKQVSTDNVVGRPITFELNVTDKNVIGNSPIFLWGNEKETETVLLAGVGSNLDPGDTGDVTIHYTPQREGTYKFYFSTSGSDLSAAFDSVEVVVGAAPIFDLVVDIDFEVEGAVNHVVSGSTLKGVAKIKNNSSEMYYSGLHLWLLQENSSDNRFYYFDGKSKTVKIQVGETVEVPFVFENLAVDTNYALYVEMMDKGQYVWVNNKDGYIPSSAVYALTGETAIKAVSTDMPDADVYDMRGVRLGKASALKSLPKGIYIINKKKVVNK